VCWPNAASETIFATLKREMYYRYRFTTQARARFALAGYIEVFYNPKRLHSTLGYQTLSEVLPHYDAATFAA
jgi:putative transposase